MADHPDGRKNADLSDTSVANCQFVRQFEHRAQSAAKNRNMTTASTQMTADTPIAAEMELYGSILSKVLLYRNNFILPETVADLDRCDITDKLAD